MKLLAIETSCDETAAAVVESSEDGTFVKLISHSLATSLAQHATTGGIIPENAARAQIQFIIPTIYAALEKAGLLEDKKQGWQANEEESRGDASETLAGAQNRSHHTVGRLGLSTASFTSGRTLREQQDPDLPNYNIPNIDAIAVTYGPGLIGSLLVGVETAKTLSYIWNKPLIPVNHLFGHVYANWIGLSSAKQNEGDRLQGETADKREGDQKNQVQWQPPQLPAIVLIVSGGHTDLLLMKNHTDITWLGGTRDDAAGEAFDKIGRILGFSYPAGPVIEERAKNGDPKAYRFPRPLLHEPFSAKGGPASGWDFSFSGLKTAVLREVTDKKLSQTNIDNLARGTQDAIIDVLVRKTLHAAEKYNVQSIILSGGVAANQTLRDTFLSKLRTNDQRLTTKFFSPPKNLCTDNAAMIGAAAIFRNQTIAWENLSANPQLYFD